MSYEDNTKLKITPDGIEIPDIETIYESVINEWNDAFGGTLRTNNRLSPQGQLAMSIAKQIDFKNKSLLFFINQFNTNTATGNFLDYQYNNFGIYRGKGNKSIVSCNCTLNAGTIINIGDEIQNEDGDIFLSTEDYTAEDPEPITVDINFEAEEKGAIPCDANTLTKIVTEKDGWVSVNNAAAGTVGTADTKSQVICQCVLEAGTIINIGDKIQNTDGNIFLSLQEYINPKDAIIHPIIFASKELGPIECKANTVNQIITTKEGWLDVNNPHDGTIGSLEENDDKFRIRAMNSHMINALGTEKALYARLMELSEVSNVYIYSNRTKNNMTEDGITINPNSTYVCIQYDGLEETKNKIAKIMHLICSTATYIGNTTVEVPIENAPNNMVDQIKFQTATKQDIFIKVSVKTLSEYSNTTDDTIKKIIMDNFNGNIENIQQCKIGEIIEANRFFENLVYLQGTNECVVSNMQISIDNTSWQDSIKIPITKFPFLELKNITVEKKE